MQRRICSQVHVVTSASWSRAEMVLLARVGVSRKLQMGDQRERHRAESTTHEADHRQEPKLGPQAGKIRRKSACGRKEQLPAVRLVAC